MSELIDADRLFQQLLLRLAIPGSEVASDLDADSFDDVPFIVHNASIAQTGNGPGLWSANLTVTVYIEASTANFDVVRAVYAGIHSWDLPTEGVVENVGRVESVDRDIEAFSRAGRDVQMNAKSITTYIGSFELTIRNY